MLPEDLRAIVKDGFARGSGHRSSDGSSGGARNENKTTAGEVSMRLIERNRSVVVSVLPEGAPLAQLTHSQCEEAEREEGSEERAKASYWEVGKELVFACFRRGEGNELESLEAGSRTR